MTLSLKVQRYGFVCLLPVQQRQQLAKMYHRGVAIMRGRMVQMANTRMMLG